MGVFRQRIEIGSPDGSRFESIEAVVDTGASFTTLPAPMLEQLGVVRHERRSFAIADGSLIERDIGFTWIRVDGRSAITVVVFGDERIRPLLGALTLEGLSLNVDPVNQRLVPVPAYLLLFPQRTG